MITSSTNRGSSRKMGPGRLAYARPARVRSTASGGPETRASLPTPTMTPTINRTTAICCAIRPLSRQAPGSGSPACGGQTGYWSIDVVEDAGDLDGQAELDGEEGTSQRWVPELAGCDDDGGASVEAVG